MSPEFSRESPTSGTNRLMRAVSELLTVLDAKLFEEQVRRGYARRVTRDGVTTDLRILIGQLADSLWAEGNRNA